MAGLWKDIMTNKRREGWSQSDDLVYKVMILFDKSRNWPRSIKV